MFTDLVETPKGLAWEVLCKLADTPSTYVELDHEIRRHRPRVWPGAIGAAICWLNRRGWVELDGVRWRVRRG